MPNHLDITGKRFSQLVAVEPVENRNGKYFWLCRCDCGKQTIVNVAQLRYGRTKSCGHLRGREKNHGGSCRGHNTPEYESWRAMLARCRNPNNIGFKDYGGRGIKVCARLHKFENLLADMGARPPGMTLDRIDNDGDYACGHPDCPDCKGVGKNIRWATRKQQRANRRQR